MNAFNDKMRALRNEIEACDFMISSFKERKEELEKELKKMVETCK